MVAVIILMYIPDSWIMINEIKINWIIKENLIDYNYISMKNLLTC